MKTCKTCSVEKPLDEFNTWTVKATGATGWRGECKSCVAVKQSNYYAQNKANLKKSSKHRYLRYKAEGKIQAYHKNRHLVKTYGITVGEWGDLFDAQGRACAICKDSDIKGHWCTDHDHNTGKVRGILCQGCNTLIGMAKDHPQVLLDAKDYLEEEGHYGEYQPSLL